MIALLLTLALGQADATPADTSGDAKMIFAEAQQRFELGDFDGALDRFTRAYELSKHPEILFNIGQCHRNLGDLRRSIFFFERYLDSTPASHPEVRQAIDEMQKELQLQAATASTAVSNEPEAPPPLIPPPEQEEDSVANKWWFWTLIGVGAAAIATGIAVSVTNDGDNNDVVTIDYRDL